MLDEKLLYMYYDVYVYHIYVYVKMISIKREYYVRWEIVISVSWCLCISHIHTHTHTHTHTHMMVASLYRRHCKVREPGYDSENDSVDHCHLCLTYRGRKVNEFLKHLWW